MYLVVLSDSKTVYSRKIKQLYSRVRHELHKFDGFRTSDSPPCMMLCYVLMLELSEPAVLRCSHEYKLVAAIMVRQYRVPPNYSLILEIID